MPPLPFRANFEPRYGEAVPIADKIERITAPNKSAFTFHGTNSYLVGGREVAVIDPGPSGHPAHYKTLMKALSGRTVSHILVTHTHIDHSPLARRLARETGAPVYAEGPHRAARDLHIGETNPLEASGDKDFVPDVPIADGARIEGRDFALTAIHTPGHTTNHMVFAMDGGKIIFSGDHVMAWATSIVAPPDGDMADYMASLKTLLARPEHVYFPGHGGRLNRAKEFIRGLHAHRKMRETAILHRLRRGDRTIPEIVAVLYKDTDPRLHGAAALSVFAHLEHLIETGKAVSGGPPSLEGEYRPVEIVS